MSSRDDQRLAELAAAIEELKLRLSRLEERAGIAAPPVQSAPAASAQPPAETAALRPPRTLETRMGLTWINRIGVITLVLGAAFFFKYAVESGWIGVRTRVLLGVAAGAGALALAERTWRSGQRIYSQGICGAGISILYLSFYAAFGLYGLIPQGLAFFLMVLATTAAGALSLRYDAAAMAALGLIGGYLTPVLLHGPEEHRVFLLGYVLLLDVGAVFVSGKRSWRWLPALAFAATVFLFAFGIRAENRVADTLFALAYYGLFASLSSEALFVAAQVAAGFAIAAVWEEGLAGYLAISSGLAIAGLVMSEQRPWRFGALGALAAFWLAYLVWYTAAPSRPMAPVFAYITFGFLIFLAREMRGAADYWRQALNPGLYFGTGYALLRLEHAAFLGLFAVMLAALYTALAYRFGRRDNRQAVLFCSGIAWVSLFLAAPIQFTAFRVTMAWSLEAAALAWIGVRFRERRALQASLAVSAFAFERLCAVDSWRYLTPHSYSAIVNERFFTFVVAAVCLWVAARWIGSGWMALATYITGHFVMLWALCLELWGWAARTALPANLRNLESSAMSILLAAYALVLVSLGVARGAAVNRMLGLGLIGMVIAKLYFYDVWYLELFYRMAAFAVLGVLLLAMSYLYSRFRASIENWWKPRS